MRFSAGPPESRTAFLLPLLLVAASFWTSVVHACSCAPPPPPLVALGRAEAVFSGTVVAKRDLAPAREGGMISSGDPVEYGFTVHDVWKGALGDSVAVVTAMSSASCGYPFKMACSYLVYAYGSDDEGRLRTGLCSRTRPLDRGAADVRELDAFMADSAEGDVGESVLLHFLEQLHADDEEARVAAAAALGDMGISKDVAVPGLSDLYHNGSERDRLAAVRALGRFATRSGGATDVLPVLVEGLRDESVDVRVAVFFPLSRLESVYDVSVPEVVEALKDTSARVKESALMALERMSRGADIRAAGPTTLELLSDRDESVRSHAVPLLSRTMPDSLAFETMVPMMKDESRHVRTSVLHQLTRLAVDAEAVSPVLVGALADTSQKVRSAAISGLGHVDHCDRAVVDALVSALDDPDGFVRSNAVRVLSSFAEEDDSAFRALEEAVGHARDDVREDALVRLGMVAPDLASVMPLVYEGLDDAYLGVQMSALHLLSRMAEKDPAAIDVLIGILQHEDPALRRAAVAKLGQVGSHSQDAIDAIYAALTDRDPEVREQAQRSLRRAEAKARRREQAAGSGGSATGSGQ